MLKYGDNNIGKVYLGSNPIGKAYLGSNLVYQKGDIHPRPVFYDRLVFDGTAYIDTDIVPPASASFRVNIGDETLKAEQRYFAISCENDASTNVFLYNSTTSTVRYFRVYYGSSSYVSSGKFLAFSNSRFSLFLTPNRFGWGEQAYTITGGDNIPIGGIVIGYNSNHTGQPFTGAIGVFRIYGSDAQDASNATDLSNNYTPVYTLRPCTYQGEAGLWCAETSTFYGNTAGAGSLSVSND